MGIFREVMNPQILVDNLEEPRLNELIDLAILAILDNAKEIGMNLLNNAHSSMIDNFRSIKWLFHTGECTGSGLIIIQLGLLPVLSSLLHQEAPVLKFTS